MMRWVILFILCVVGHACVAQLTDAQRKTLETETFHTHKFDARKPGFYKMGKNPIIAYNPLSLLLSTALFGYQKVLSPQLQSHCPYEISCSAYSKVAISEFGLFKGVFMTADRLTRCTQFSTMDLLPSQINHSTGYIKDDVTRYRFKQHKH